MTEKQRGLLLSALAGLLIALWTLVPTGRPVTADAEQNLRAAWNLAHHGVLSTSDAADPAPDMFREPLTPLITGALIKVGEVFSGPSSFETWNGGAGLHGLKQQNIVWIALLWAGVLAAAQRLSLSPTGQVAALALANGFVWALRSELVDSLGTDLAAAALLTLGAATTVAARQTRDWRRWLGAGLVFGLAILVKASLLYVLIGLAGALLLLAAWRNRGWPGDRAGVGLLLMLTVAALVVSPWSERNRALFGTLAIADRGGEVLLLRAYENQVTPVELAGSLCAYSPGKLQAQTCRLTGHALADLRPGGSLARFSRMPPKTDEARLAVRAAAEAGGPSPGLSFYNVAKERYRVLVERTGSTRAADEAAKAEAIALIKARPDLHLAMTAAFLWRGLGGLTIVLLAVGAVALARRRDDLVVFLLPFVGLGFFMALFSHFIPRYGWPMIPALCVVLPLIAEAGLRRIRK